MEDFSSMINGAEQHSAAKGPTNGYIARGDTIVWLVDPDNV